MFDFLGDVGSFLRGDVPSELRFPVKVKEPYRKTEEFLLFPVLMFYLAVCCNSSSTISLLESSSSVSDHPSLSFCSFLAPVTEGAVTFPILSLSSITGCWFSYSRPPSISRSLSFSFLTTESSGYSISRLLVGSGAGSSYT